MPADLSAIYENSSEIPALRTTDLDFLVEDPKYRGELIDVPKILESLGFTAEYDQESTLVKYERNDLEIEFLSQRFRMVENVIPVPKLLLTAQVLSYMEIAKKFTQKIQYKGIRIKVPEIEAFILHKILVLPHRGTKTKREKDAQTVSGIANLISANSSMRARAREIFDTFYGKWQRKILQTAKDEFPVLFEILKTN